jgi:antitoxin MazE
MTNLIKIGNSHGIRIPKPIIEQACLSGKELKLVVVNEGLLISSQMQPREHWEKAINRLLSSQGQEEVDTEWLDAPLITDDQWEW